MLYFYGKKHNETEGPAMIKIAIVEDEAAVRDQLTDYVRRYTRQYGTEFEVTCFTDGDEILENYRPAFDIIFLDVEMKRLNGMETAQRIRELDDDVLRFLVLFSAVFSDSNDVVPSNSCSK